MPTTATTATVHEAFVAVAPEIDDELRALATDVDVWAELQLDSMDHLAVIENLSAAIGIDIPEADYPELITLDAIHRYVEQHAS
jgi:acyl carrier protein